MFERGIVQLNHLVEKGHVKSVKYFMNLGMKGNNLLMIIDVYDAIPRLWKDDSGLIIIIIIAHIYNAPNTTFLGAEHIITPVIGFRLTRTQGMHILHSLGSIPASRHFTSAT